MYFYRKVPFFEFFSCLITEPIMRTHGVPLTGWCVHIQRELNCSITQIYSKRYEHHTRYTPPVRHSGNRRG